MEEQGQQANGRVSNTCGAGDNMPFGVSMRGWIALIVVMTVCLMSGLGIVIVEPLYSMATMALGFYFGQKVNQNKTP